MVKYLIAAALFIGLSYIAYIQFGAAKIDFNTQVKPLLNRKCITCHGGVKREAGFSLLFRTDALAATQSGKPAIVPFKPHESAFIHRLTHPDPDERMPYHEAPLSTDEIQMLTQWVKEGATWGEHWAYLPIENTVVPKPTWLFGLLPKPKPDWVKNEVDYFILDKLKQQNLNPSVQADKRSLLRRLSLDLTGLPPDENLRQQFLNDNSDKAYENLVDTLLNSLAFGERWTAMWLDLARYADTKGYERDDKRSIWRYRDWLIKAFNADMPYNQFLTEQIAGDLLPNATDAQLLATAFHRNTMTNDEGGTDNEEFRTAAVIDRVNTTWETLMGTTFSCVQCHSHPYDPFRHEEYYQFMAFFNNTRDEDTHPDYPLLREYRQTDSLKYLELQGWLKTNLPDRWQDVSHFVKTLHPSYNSLTANDFQNSELSDTKYLVLRKNGSARLQAVDFEGKDQFIFPYKTKAIGGRLTISLDSLGGKVLAILSLDTTGKEQFADFDLPATVSGKHDVYFAYANPLMKKMDENGVFFDWFYLTKRWTARTAAHDSSSPYAKFWSLIKSKNFDATPILQENPLSMQRKTHVFERGNWLVKGDEVQPNVPKSLNPFPANAPRNRLGLAAWLTDTRHPLTARTYVNRLWEQLFGQGIVETLEDMGTQGLPPTHRELLDYLAYQFMHQQNWSSKKLLKTLVMSATYQQDSKLSADSENRDPQNKYYARAPRIRLSAEQMRDQILAVSGLLNPTMYGKSVFPYQPDGVWSSPWNGASWKQDSNGNQYRRALYTYWKRSSPYPAMMTFDGVNREVCMARRIRTNTPLQALAMLNDSAYLVAAMALAKKTLNTEGGLSSQIEKIYELATGQILTPEKKEILEKLYAVALRSFASKKGGKALSIAQKTKALLIQEPPEIAALAVVANAILNLDEFVNKS
jgi:hypothetical protein